MLAVQRIYGAQIDLKNAKIYIRDGYSLTGAVNNGAGYAIGTTTMTVDGITGAVVDDDLFYMDALKLNRYKITSHSETLGNTTSITFTPGLIAAVVDDDALTVGPHQVEVEVGEGNLTYVEKKAREYTLNRGVLNEVRDADEEPMDVSLDFTWTFLKADGTDQDDITIEDALKKQNGASGWTSVDSDTCRPFAVDIVIENIPACTDGTKAEVITLEDFRYEQLSHDADAGSVAMTGRCNKKEATIERVATS